MRPFSTRVAVAAIVLVAVSGCSAMRRTPVDDRPVVVFLGDSLTRGAQLELSEHYPALLEKRFARVDLPVRVVNAGYPGDTSAGGLARLVSVLEQDPDVLVVELGLNDAKNDIPPQQTADNLRAIVAKARSRGAAVVLVGARVARPWADEVSAAVAAVAREQEAWLIEDLLAGVVGVERLNLADGAHPNAAGQRVLAENVWPELFRVVVEISTARQAAY